MLTEEQKKTVEEYLYIPKWLVFQKLGLRHAIIARLVHVFGSAEDVVSELHFAVIRAVQTFRPDKTAKLGTWVRRHCTWHLQGLMKQAKDYQPGLALLDMDFCKEEKPGLLDTFEVPWDILLPRERFIAVRRLREDKLSLAQLSDLLGISRERVRQIYMVAIGKLVRRVEKDLDVPERYVPMYKKRHPYYW